MKSLGNVEYIKLSKHFSNFKDKESLNTSIRQHLYNKKSELTPSAIAVYKLLARYAVKYAGCAFLKIDKIAELTGYARRTVIKALSLLEKLSIVLRRHVMRAKTGGNGANVYVLQKYRENEIIQNNKINECTPSNAPRPTDENAGVTSDEGDNLESETLINLNPCNKELIRMSSPYERFKSIVFSYVKDKDILYKLYGVYLGQTKYLKDAYRESELINAAVYSLRTVFNKMKTKQLRNIAGYFNGVLSNTLDKLYYESIASMSFEYETEQTKEIEDVNEVAADELTEVVTAEIYADIEDMLAKFRAVPPPSFE